MKRDALLFIKDILDNIDLIEKSIGKTSKEEFSKDQMLQDATIRRIEVIGEAAKNIPKNVKEKYSDIEWKKIIGTRDIIIHAYFEVDLDIVWNVIKKDIPILKENILRIKEELERS